MTKPQILDKDGKPIADEIAKDGESIRVPVMMMDGDAVRAGAGLLEPHQRTAYAHALNRGLDVFDAIAEAGRVVKDSQRPQAAMHRPGYATLTDADRAAREQAHDARDKRLVDAWKSPPAVDTAQIQKPAPTSPQLSAADQRDARLRDAWRI
jgi:hypothetical protein